MLIPTVLLTGKTGFVKRKIKKESADDLSPPVSPYMRQILILMYIVSRMTSISTIIESL